MYKKVLYCKPNIEPIHHVISYATLSITSYLTQPYPSRHILRNPIHHVISYATLITSYLTQPYPLRHILRNPIHYVISYATLSITSYLTQPNSSRHILTPSAPVATTHRQNLTQSYSIVLGRSRPDFARRKFLS